jgi:selT/selW/selH-like putative selenoprotein
MGFIGLTIFGDYLFTALNRPVPDFYAKIQQNKWSYGFGAFYIGNMIQGNLLSTGAFEIFVNDKLVFSKIDTGKMPDAEVINQILLQQGIIDQ